MGRPWDSLAWAIQLSRPGVPNEENKPNLLRLTLDGSVLCCNLLYCIGIYDNVIYYTVLFCIVMYSTILYNRILYCTKHYIILDCNYISIEVEEETMQPLEGSGAYSPSLYLLWMVFRGIFVTNNWYPCIHHLEDISEVPDGPDGLNPPNI